MSVGGPTSAYLIKPRGEMSSAGDSRSLVILVMIDAEPSKVK